MLNELLPVATLIGGRQIYKPPGTVFSLVLILGLGPDSKRLGNCQETDPRLLPPKNSVLAIAQRRKACMGFPALQPNGDSSNISIRVSPVIWRDETQVFSTRAPPSNPVTCGCLKQEDLLKKCSWPPSSSLFKGCNAERETNGRRGWCQWSIVTALCSSSWQSAVRHKFSASSSLVSQAWKGRSWNPSCFSVPSASWVSPHTVSQFSTAELSFRG